MSQLEESGLPAAYEIRESRTEPPRSGVAAHEGEDRPLGLPAKVLYTSLGMALAAHMLLAPGLLIGGGAAYAQESDEPKLTEWSSEEVKAYYDPGVDWNLPALPDENLGNAVPQATAGSTGTSGTSGGGGGNTTIIHQGSSFGWDDMLLYHLLFNSGGSYSSGRWHQSYPSYDARTNQPYQPKTYSAGTFQNKQVPGSKVTPKTSVSSGSFNTKSGSINKAAAAKSGTASGGTGGSGAAAGAAAGSAAKTTDTSKSSSSTKSTDTSSTKSTTSGTSSSSSDKSASSSSSKSSSGSSSSSGKSSSSSSSNSSSSSGKSTSSGSIGGKSSGFSGSSSSGS